MNANEKWLREKAAIEDQSIVTAGHPPTAGMTYNEFLDTVIRVGIEGAKKSYGGTDSIHHPAMLKGAVAGFESCKGMNPIQLFDQLTAAETRQATAYGADDARYWECACFASEVRWVCNVVSVLLMNEGRCMLLIPTCRAVLLADEILRGVYAVKPTELCDSPSDTSAPSSPPSGASTQDNPSGK